MPERISYTTADQVTIVGDWYTAPTMIGAMLLIPMMREGRASWAMLQRSLAKLGIASLAIDLRGHGESTQGWQGTRLDYRNFEDADHQTSISDVYYGLEWIKARGIGVERMAIGGASFGANLALRMMAEDPTLSCGVALSCGANYRGTNAIESSRGLMYNQSLFLVASEEDKESFDDTKKVFEMAVCEKKVFLPYKGAGHGTDILRKDTDLNDKISDWVWNVFRG